MSVAHALAKEWYGAAHPAQEESYGDRSCNGYQEGDAVFILNTVKMWGRSPWREVDPWKGPFIITCGLSDTMFEVRGYSQDKSRIMQHNCLKSYPDVELPR